MPNPKNISNGSGGNTREKLKSVVERMENLEAEQKSLTADKKTIMEEAKAAGFNPKEVRGLLKRRALDAEQRAKMSDLEEAIDLLEHLMNGTGLPAAKELVATY